ncbi:MAG: hypothetical protein JJ992_08790, partial [Planctomycetes bacterium]|nr:hypothetical protein [Planctomycetota bacterium]
MSRAMIRVSPVLSLTLFLITGCQPTASTPPDAPPSNPPSSSADASATDAALTGEQAAAPVTGEVTVQVKSWEEVQQMVVDRKGQVVVIDLWSTWCVPCMREFPHLV